MKKCKKIDNQVNPYKFINGISVVMFILTVICGCSSIVQIYAVSEFIDYACNITQNIGKRDKISLSVLVLVITISIDWLMPKVIEVMKKKSEITLIKKYRFLVIEKCAKIKYEYFEDSDRWDLINRVVKEPEKQWMDLLVAILELVKLAISILGILVVIASDVWWAAIVIFIFCFPIFFIAVKGGKKSYQAKRDASEYNRRYSYFDKVLYDKDFLEERKLFGYVDMVSQKYTESFNKAFWIETQTAIHWAVKTKLSGGLSMIAAFIIVITLIGPTINGEISVGMFMSLVNAVFLLTSQMSWGLSRNIDKIVVGREYKKDVQAFFELDEDEGSLDEPSYVSDIKEIEFKNVSFSYPGSDKNVLNLVSFVMKKGKKYALVGPNGAGKSTVVKLLLGLYSEYSGDILINGKELKEYSKAEQKGIYSVVFQDYVKHFLTIRENCIMSDSNCKNIDKQIETYLERFELKDFVDNLPNGLSTLLGKVGENGIELSGGQWQKLAMIRALLRPTEIQILDEPTASLDPKNESEIYKLFQTMAKDKLTILISHRLGFSKDADEILVFENGTVYEKGDFNTLMSKDGLFSKMYNKQKEWYE